MMKGQLAGLMKQAQQMQENMKKAQMKSRRWRSKARQNPEWSRSPSRVAMTSSA